MKITYTENKNGIYYPKLTLPTGTTYSIGKYNIFGVLSIYLYSFIRTVEPCFGAGSKIFANIFTENLTFRA